MIGAVIAGVGSFLNGSLFPLFIGIGGIIYFAYLYFNANKVADKNRKNVQQNIINKATISIPKKTYFVASAGSLDSDGCAEVSAIDIKLCNFVASNGEPLNINLYNCYVVHGNSMKYAGINDNDFIFVPKDFNIKSLRSFPEILVIRYRKEQENKPVYKVRRTWYKGTIEDNLEKVASTIMEIPKFKRLTLQEGYMGPEWMIKDLRDTRLAHYRDVYFKDGVCQDQYKEIVISTTFDTIKKEIHFSIHPVSLVVGNVEESYTL